MTKPPERPLVIAEFGDPILRQKSKHLTAAEIKSPRIQHLIQDMRQTLLGKQIGIGLAAPQVGQGVALAVIAVRPLPHRPDVEELDLTIINPRISKRIGQPIDVWEGCISSGHGEANLFAKVPRYDDIEMSYLDENGHEQTGRYTGLVAQVIQHEIDHLAGTLFVDHVTDPTTYMTMQEYVRRVRKTPKNK